jgi:hypothetical protein
MNGNINKEAGQFLSLWTVLCILLHVRAGDFVVVDSVVHFPACMCLDDVVIQLM